MNAPAHEDSSAEVIPKNYDGRSKYGRSESACYDSQRENESIWHKENDFINRYFSSFSPSRLLDAPVGTGRFLAYYPRETEVIGIDISKHMLDEAYKKVLNLERKNVELHVGDIFRLPYSDGFFDAVVCWRLLHLLPVDNLIPALSELRRICRGRIIIQAFVQGPRLVRLVSRALRYLGRTFSVIADVPLYRTSEHITSYIHSYSSLESAFEVVGLRITESYPLSYYCGHKLWVYVLE